MTTLNPQDYPRRVLIAVTGLSPQIVTETLYALTQVQKPPFMPSEVVLITTAEGAERAELTLLSEEPGWFQRLLEEYGLAPIQFDKENIHIIRDQQGNALLDIRTPDENSQVADQISEIIRNLAGDEEAALHVSIAGGRKTMGFYLGYALSLFGRPQDRLSHVLVDAGYESHPDFYFPTRAGRVIFTPGPNGRPLDASKAAVALADIPFVRLRDGLPAALLQGESGFSETIEAAQRLYGPRSLVIDRKALRMVCGELAIEMTPTDLAFYAFMARRARNGERPVRWSDASWKLEYLTMLAAIVPEASGIFTNAEEALVGDDDGKEYFEQRKSRTNSTLKRRLGDKLAERYLIHSYGRRPHTRYGLAVEADAIQFEE